MQRQELEHNRTKGHSHRQHRSGRAQQATDQEYRAQQGEAERPHHAQVPELDGHLVEREAAGAHERPHPVGKMRRLRLHLRLCGLPSSDALGQPSLVLPAFKNRGSVWCNAKRLWPQCVAASRAPNCPSLGDASAAAARLPQLLACRGHQLSHVQGGGADRIVLPQHAALPHHCRQRSGAPACKMAGREASATSRLGQLQAAAAAAAGAQPELLGRMARQHKVSGTNLGLSRGREPAPSG